MTIKLTLLKTGETIISEMQELVAKGQEETQAMPNAYLLKSPHVVRTRIKTLSQKMRKKENNMVLMCL